MRGLKTLAVGALMGLLLCASNAFAAVQQNNFTLTGTGGITGTGSITWDDTVIANGSFVNDLTNIISLNITMTGGAAGAGQSYTKAQCSNVFFDTVPDFASGMTYWCDNGSLSFDASGPYTSNAAGSTITWTPGVTTPVAVPAPVPTLSEWAMITFAMLIAGFGIYQQRRRQF